MTLQKLTEEQEAALELLLSHPETVQRLISMADEDEKREWLFTLIRKTAAYVAAVLTAIILFWDSFIKMIKGALGI